MAYRRGVTDERFDQIIGEMRAAHSNFWGREPKVLLLGSDALHRELGDFGVQIINVEKVARARGKGAEHMYATTRNRFESLLNVARNELGIGPLVPQGDAVPRLPVD